MIRPASEIEYPPSKAMCTKARMIVRMETLGDSAKGLTSILAERVSSADEAYHAEIEALAHEQDRLISNMRRIIRK